ncbi:unnamed protein product, partial [Allacma fusca]
CAQPNSQSPFVDITAVLVGRSSVATVLATKLRYSTRTMSQLVLVEGDVFTYYCGSPMSIKISENLMKRILREARPKSMNLDLDLFRISSRSRRAALTLDFFNEVGSGDSQLMFKLTHCEQILILFQPENSSSAEKWIGAFQEATVLITIEKKIVLRYLNTEITIF